MDIKPIILKAIYGEPTEQEREILEEWLREGKNQGLYETLRTYLQSQDSVRFLAEIDVERALRRLRRRRIRPFAWAGAAAASILIAVVLSVHLRPAEERNIIDSRGSLATMTLSTGEVLYLGDTSLNHHVRDANINVADSVIEVKGRKTGGEDTADGPVYSVLEVPRGECYSLVLADGTRVRVNALSRLEFPLSFAGLGERKVKLEGEAFFEVAKDTLVPFRVETARQVISVTGTAFNVAAYGGEDERTTLCQGSVEVRTMEGDTVALIPGQQLAISETGKVSVSEVDVRLYTAWKDGKFVFDGETVVSIMERLARWYGLEVFYENEGVKEELFFGVITRFADVREVLRMMERTGSIRFEVKDNVVTVR